MSGTDCCKGGSKTVIPVTGLSLECDLGGVLGELPGCEQGIDFSFEEQWTGRRWIDGKKIYQKTVNCGGLPNNTAKSVPHAIVGLDKVVAANGWARNPMQAPIFINLPHVGATGVALIVMGNDIRVSAYGNYSAYSEAYVTLFYTRSGAE